MNIKEDIEVTITKEEFDLWVAENLLAIGLKRQSAIYAVDQATKKSFTPKEFTVKCSRIPGVQSHE